MADGEKRSKPTFDWEAIEASWRTGTLSTRCIAARYGITEAAIRRRVKRDDWTRDLSDQVRVAVRSALVRKPIDPRTEKEIVRECAHTSAGIIRKHRKAIANQQELALLLTERLTLIIRGEPCEAVCMGSGETPVIMLDKLCKITGNLIRLERQAFNLDDGKEQSSDPLGQLLGAIDGRGWRRDAIDAGD